MKKIFSFSILITAIFSLLHSSNTYAVYMAADNGLEAAYEENLSQMREASSYLENSQIIVKADLSSASYTFRVTAGRIDTIYISGSINSGDPTVPAAFFAYVFNTFPADNEIAVFWDHGNGWEDIKSGEKSIFYDNHPYDFISVISGEFKEMLSRVKAQTGRKIDLILFDACAMQCAEVLYDISDYAKYSAGSPLIVPFYGLPYSKILRDADTLSDIEEIGKAVCEDYFERYSSERDSISFSLLKLSAVKEAASRFEPSSPQTYSRISSMEVMINDSISKSLIYEKGSLNEFDGIKIFYPESYSLFEDRYDEYRKLPIDTELDIMKREFSTYGVRDTLPPILDEPPSIYYDGFCNYRVTSQKAYDLSGVEDYTAYFSSKAEERSEDFSDTSLVPFAGVYSYTSYSALSEPYSVFVSSVDTIIEVEDDIAVVGFGIMGKLNSSGLSVTNNGDIVRNITGRYEKWRRFYFPVRKGEVRIKYDREGDDFLYIDDVYTAAGGIRKESSKSESFLIHKAESGRNMLLLTASDIWGNESAGDTLCFFTAEDSVGISVFPNPASDFINILSEYTGIYTLMILSADGGNSCKFSGVKTSEAIRVELRDLPIERGMHYIIIIIDGKTFKGKFLKV